MRTFLRIFKYAGPLGYTLPTYLLLIVLATAFSVINLSVLIPLLQVLFDQVEIPSADQTENFSFSIDYFKGQFYHQLAMLIHSQGKLAALYFICGFVTVSVFLANVFRYASQLILARVRVRVIRNLRNATLDEVLGLDLSFFSHHLKGDTISRITMDIQDVEQSVVSSLKVFIKEPFLIIGYFVALLTISAELTVYTILLIPTAGFGVSIIARRIRQWAKRSQKSMGKITQTLDETFSGIRVVKAFNAIDFIKSRFAKDVDRYANQNLQIATRSNLSSPISEIVGVVVLVIILVVGGRLVLSAPPQLSASEFIGFLVIFSQLLNPAKALSVCVSQISKGLASATRVFELMDKQPEVLEHQAPLVPGTLARGVTFKNVSFSYGNEQVLTQFDLHIPKGKVVALVGPSGAGKSTISDLLCRFYDPTDGEIMVDDINLRQIALAPWRSMIALVSQEPILFNDTIANNISFGQPNAKMEEIVAAAKVAFAHEFILGFDAGYDTLVGERGNRLSGGQKQRITIARAIFRNPEILILDEATSSLDAKSEQEVQQATANLMMGRTTLLIAHRLSTIQHADHIVVIDKGCVIAQGSHEELIKKDDLYRQLTQLQTF